MVNMQPTIESLRELNSRLVLQIDELRKKFTELEKKNQADTANLTAENNKLKDKATKLEQIQTHNDNKKHIAKLDDDIKKIKQISTLVPEEQYSANINASCEMNSEGNLKQIDSQYGNTSASDITDNTSNSNEPDKNSDQCSTSICMETKSSEDKEIEEFLDQVYKKNSNEIREGNQKKKLQSQGSVQNTSDIQNEVNPVIDQEQNTKVKISYNKRVEQDLRCDLSLFIKDNNNKVSEDRVENIKRINKIDDQSARTLVYNKIKALLLDISDVNLRQKTFRVKKIYMLLMGIGIEKVQAITCSASTISKDMIRKDKTLLETKCSDGNDDYYRITNNTLCPLCRLDHGDDDIEGEYKNGTYYIKCIRKKLGLNAKTSESSQIEKTNNYLSQDCVIKISKFPEEKSTIHEAVHKRFPFLTYTNSNAWYRNVFKYTNSEVKCPICKEVHNRLGI
ncbi:16680_t:CDS:2 [Gigaspora rosea]|nr:16680_t:CDS:2 [Gigaspora rosea]